VPPPGDKRLFWDEGAIDDIVRSEKGKQIIVRSVPDKAVKRKRIPKYTNKVKRTFDAGGGIEADRKGRGHIKV